MIRQAFPANVECNSIIAVYFFCIVENCVFIKVSCITQTYVVDFLSLWKTDERKFDISHHKDNFQYAHSTDNYRRATQS